VFRKEEMQGVVGSADDDSMSTANNAAVAVSRRDSRREALAGTGYDVKVKERKYRCCC
jgi:hypothetical protein